MRHYFEGEHAQHLPAQVSMSRLTWGILRSSTNTAMCFPAGGPYTPLCCFSSLPSMISCRSQSPQQHFLLRSLCKCKLHPVYLLRMLGPSGHTQEQWHTVLTTGQRTAESSYSCGGNRRCPYLRHVCTFLRTERDYHRHKRVLWQARLQMLLDIHSLARAGGPHQQAVVVMTHQGVEQVGVTQSISCTCNTQQ